MKIKKFIYESFMFFKTKLLPFITMLFQNGLRNQVLIVSRFCFTYLYLLFVLLSMLPFFLWSKRQFYKFDLQIYSILYPFFSLYPLILFKFSLDKGKNRKFVGQKVFRWKTWLALQGFVTFSFFFIDNIRIRPNWQFIHALQSKIRNTRERILYQPSWEVCRAAFNFYGGDSRNPFPNL